MSWDYTARMHRLMEVVDKCIEHDQVLTDDDLKQILDDSGTLFTREAYRVVRALVRQIRET